MNNAVRKGITTFCAVVMFSLTVHVILWVDRAVEAHTDPGVPIVHEHVAIADLAEVRALAVEIDVVNLKMQLLENKIDELTAFLNGIVFELTGTPPTPIDEGETTLPEPEPEPIVEPEIESGETEPEFNDLPDGTARRFHVMYPYGDGIVNANWSFSIADPVPVFVIVTDVFNQDGTPISSINVYSFEAERFILPNLSADENGIVSFTLNQTGGYIFGW